MATIRMKKGDTFADVFDSDETIRTAQLDGYSLVEKRNKKDSNAEICAIAERTEKPAKVK